ncbi:MAG TPA: hypothetical protein VMW16_11995 [Sedimentisphaerales bacterium]|nr:hypothetical protein [Sedimentisphaerales bacterium]
MDDAIVERIGRIYAAVGGLEEDDPAKLRANVIQTERIKGLLQDFRGDLTDDDLCNYAHMAIDNIANLRDHLKGWAVHNGQNKARVDEAVNNSLGLQIVIDLADNDKHGYPPRNGGYSGKCPKLVKINRVMELRTRAKEGSTIGMTLGAGGVPKFFGDGTGKAIITGDVVDNNNKRIGELSEIIGQAVDAWERLLGDFGF